MNNITLEWSQQDRDRIDALTDAIKELTAVLSRPSRTTPKKATEAPKASTPTENPQEPENAAPVKQTKPTEAPTAKTEPEEPKKEEKANAAPSITVEDIRKKVVTLSAAGKKAEVKAIINKYAPTITELPADSYIDVMLALQLLEG